MVSHRKGRTQIEDVLEGDTMGIFEYKREEVKKMRIDVCNEEFYDSFCTLLCTVHYCMDQIKEDETDCVL